MKKTINIKTIIKNLSIGTFAVIIFIICLTGFYKYLITKRPGYYAGEIFNTKITSQKFNDIQKHIKVEKKLEMGQMFETLESLVDMDELAWERLIVLDYARKNGIKTTNKEIIKRISEFDFFFRQNKFDSYLYNRILKESLQSDPQTFEEMIRESINLSKVYDKVTANINLNDSEILDEYKNLNEKIKISYINVTPDDFKKDIFISDEQMMDFYNNNKSDFLISSSINIEYIKLDFPEDGGIQKQVEMKYKAKAIIEEYSKKPDFTALGEKYKSPVKETGFFTKQNPNFDMNLKLQQLMSLFREKTGALLSFETDEGYVVTKIKSKKRPHIPQYTQVKEQIKEKLINEAALKKAQSKAELLLKEIKEKWAVLNNEQKDFNTLVKELGFEVKNTPLLSKKEAANSLRLYDDFKESSSNIFSLSDENRFSGAIPSPSGAIIAYLETYEPIDEKKFKTDKGSFSDMVLRTKKDGAFADFITNLKKQANTVYY